MWESFNISLILIFLFGKIFKKSLTSLKIDSSICNSNNFILLSFFVFFGGQVLKFSVLRGSGHLLLEKTGTAPVLLPGKAGTTPHFPFGKKGSRPSFSSRKIGGQVFKFSVMENRRWVVMGVTYPKNRL